MSKKRKTKIRCQFYLHQQGLRWAPGFCAWPSVSPSQERNSSPWVFPWTLQASVFPLRFWAFIWAPGGSSCPGKAGACREFAALQTPQLHG